MKTYWEFFFYKRFFCILQFSSVDFLHNFCFYIEPDLRKVCFIYSTMPLFLKLVRGGQTYFVLLTSILLVRTFVDELKAPADHSSICS